MNTYFDNKIIWITGASSGIGKALALDLAKLNCKLYITARNQEKLDEIVAQSDSAKVTALVGDLTDKQTNASICDTIMRENGRLDIAVLNAGTCEYVDIDNFNSALFERVMNTNFISMVYGIEACLPLLYRSKHAQLIGMSSTAAYLGLPRSEAYGASKAAIRNMFAALRVSLHHKEVSASVICPGFVETELTAQNDFAMPALITAQKASSYILKGIVNKTQEIHFPLRFSLTLKLIGSLPNPLLSWILRKTVVRP